MEKDDIQRLRLEDCLVTEFVKGVNRKFVQRAMQIDERDDGQPVRPAQGIPGGGACTQQHSQESQCLQHALGVAALVEARQIGGRRRRPIELNPSLLPVCGHRSTSRHSRLAR